MPTLFAQAYEAVLKQLEEMPQFLQSSLSGLPAQLLQQRPACDDMSLVEHLCHVRDCDPDLYAFRVRLILKERVPYLDPVDVGVWPEERGYASQEPVAVLHDFVRARAEFLEELRGLREDELGRTGRRADGSEVNVLAVLAQIAEHDWDHKRRIAAILREFSSNAAVVA